MSQLVGTVVITGASSGIGRCTALMFGRNGWNVGLIARGPVGLAAIHSELVAAGGHAAYAPADVADAGALDDAAALLESELGPITVWVNCAGNGVYGRFLDVTIEEFRRVTDVTYMGTVNGTRSALQRMVPRNAGTVINVCSAIAFGGLPVLSSYSGAKCAVRGFTDSVRHELIQERSRVMLTAIFPPAVNTPFFGHAASHLMGSPRPAKPVYQPEIVADAILLAATHRQKELRVTGTTVVFNLATRFIPGIVHMAIQRLGSSGQRTDDEAVVRLREPTLFAPSPHASGTHGPFDAESRGFSMQMWLSGRSLAGWLMLSRLVVSFRPASRSRPRPVARDPDPMRARSVQPPAGP